MYLNDFCQEYLVDSLDELEILLRKRFLEEVNFFILTFKDNSSTMYDTKGKNLHAEEVLMQEVENLEKVGTWPREACGIDEHNCLGQLEDKDIKVEKHNH